MKDLMKTAAVTAVTLTAAAATTSPPARSRPAATSTSPFWAGGNLPWVHFGYDVGGGSFDPAAVGSAFGNLSAAGANAVRFWLHADGRASPAFAPDGTVAAPGGSTWKSDLRTVLQLAASHELVLQLCLWSFDMCKQEVSTIPVHAELIRNASKAESYIENALLPMLALLDGSPVVVEVINEPEWCMEGPCNTKECVTTTQMQAFVARVAEAVHNYSELAVTVGSASLKWSTSRPGGGQADYWSDSALKAAYPAATGDSGTLDLFNVHYYDWMYDPSWGYDPCRKPASYWSGGATTKPVVVAELPPGSDHYNASAMLECALRNGFAGDLFWAINDPSFPFGPAYDALRSFTSAHATATSYHKLVTWLRTRPLPLPEAAAMDYEVHELVEGGEPSRPSTRGAGSLPDSTSSRKWFSREAFWRAKADPTTLT